jgi:hypothetical protein
VTEDSTESPPPFISVLSDEEVLQRMKGLIALGNKPKVAELILLQAGAMPDQVQAALKQIDEEAQAEIKEQNYVGWVIILGGIILVLLGLYLWQTRPNSEENTTPFPPAGNLLDNWIDNFISTRDIPPINNLPEPIVTFDENIVRGSCPRNASEAGTLFGGQSGTWDYQADTNGWLFYDNAPSQLKIPDGMSASFAFGSARSPEFLPAYGPARAANVHLAFILCP